MELAELGQEYAAIVLRQETGKDVFGNTVKRYQPGDATRLSEIENTFQDNDDYTLMQYVENWFEMQEENLS